MFSEITSEQELKEAVESLVKEHDLGIEVEIADRFKRKAGQYQHGEKKIRISKYLLENHSEKVIETLKHEIGHAVVMQKCKNRNTRPHGEEWKSVMHEIGVENPEACHSLQLTDYNYIVRCINPDCGLEIGRHRKSRLVKKPESYLCSECGSKLESFKVE